MHCTMAWHGEQDLTLCQKKHSRHFGDLTSAESAICNTAWEAISIISLSAAYMDINEESFLVRIFRVQKRHLSFRIWEVGISELPCAPLLGMMLLLRKPFSDRAISKGFNRLRINLTFSIGIHVSCLAKIASVYSGMNSGFGSSLVKHKLDQLLGWPNFPTTVKRKVQQPTQMRVHRGVAHPGGVTDPSTCTLEGRALHA
uniref:Uncharacterized protein n=1 Tax=Cannabis sativa TaxID=3483 RepID=A0A803NIM4_CANSA